jgi:hypothetical protein
MGVGGNSRTEPSSGAAPDAVTFTKRLKITEQPEARTQRMNLRIIPRFLKNDTFIFLSPRCNFRRSQFQVDRHLKPCYQPYLIRALSLP